MLYYDYMEEQREKNKAKKILKCIGIVLICILVLVGSFFITYFLLMSNYNKNKTTVSTNIQNHNTSIDEKTEITENVIQDNSVTMQLHNQNELEEQLLPKVDETTQNKIIDIYYSEEKQVYLTFDDGPSRTVTPQILDVLKENNVKASFFVLGSRAESNPDILKRAYDEGHYIANHGYSHVYSSIYAQAPNVLEEYNTTEQIIKDAIGNQKYNSHFFRFPGGSSGRTI